MPLHQLPLTVLEMQHAREAELDGSLRRVELRPSPGPSDAPLAHRVNVPDQPPGIAVGLTHHLDPDPSGGIAVLPLLDRVGPESLEAGLARDPVTHRLLVAVAQGIEEADDDASDLLRGLHARSLARDGRKPQPRTGVALGLNGESN
jgi:hypothetical protein